MIVFFAFFVPISKSGTSIFSIFMILAWIGEGDLKHKLISLKDNHLLLVLLGIIFYSCIALFWSSNIEFALDFIRKYWHFLVIPIIITSLDQKYLNYVISAFLLAMVISEVFSYGIFFELWKYKDVPPTMPTPFMDHANYSVYLAFTGFLLLYKIINQNNIKSKLLYGVFLLFSTSNLFANGGRTGQLAFLICLFLFAMFRFRNKIKGLFLITLVVITLFTSAYTLSPNFKYRMDYTARDIHAMVVEKKFQEAFSIRVALWIMGIHQFIDNPITGTGIGDEAVGIKKYVDKYNFTYFVHITKDTKYIDLHNGYLQYAVSMGIVGLALFCLVLFFLLTVKLKDKNYQELSIIFATLIILLSVIGPSLHIMASMVLFALFSGVFGAVKKRDLKWE